MFCTSGGNSASVMSMRPVPGSLSSLLHLHNRQRQPMPASMPGTLPNPTMPGSSAVLMPMERQMSVNSNLLGMQGPNLSNPCASPQVQPMHSEAKMDYDVLCCLGNTSHKTLCEGNLPAIQEEKDSRG
uniref:cAMP responsive element binding protein 5 n=1 Tax=Ailuropoda melanoleuca TaxID=9646 RepID=A0A7N5JUW6_AILME